MKYEKTKFKYSKNSVYTLDTMKEYGFQQIQQPFHTKDGLYLFRGENKDERLEICVIDGNWYIIDIRKEYRLFTISDYNLFPSLPDSEYRILKKCYSRLQKEWKLYVDAYYLHKLYRSYKLDALRCLHY